MNGEDDMSQMFRPGAHLMMGPITGIRPDDERWGGEMVEEHIMAIYDDVMNSDLPDMLDKCPDDASLVDIIGMAVLQAIVRTGQRLAVELDGCTIDTTTIFEDEDYNEFDEDDFV